jgi:hypothetical protein
MLKTALRQRMNTKPASAGAEQRERGGIGDCGGSELQRHRSRSEGVNLEDGTR